MSQELSCHVCGAELGLDHLFVDADDRAAVASLIEVAMPLGGRLLQYTRLFAPPKTRLTQRKQLRIVMQLLPDLKRCAISHRNRDWSVPLVLWAQGFDLMLSQRDAGKLELPMTGHKYLYAILASLADKAEAVTEVQTEAANRAPVQAASFQVRGQAMPMGQALATVFGDVTPALAKLDSERGKETGMPADLRERLKTYKGERS